MFISSHKSFIEVSICRAQYFIVIMHHGDYKFSQKTFFLVEIAVEHDIEFFLIL